MTWIEVAGGTSDVLVTCDWLTLLAMPHGRLSGLDSVSGWLLNSWYQAVIRLCYD